jgi:hypothetical protein
MEGEAVLSREQGPCMIRARKDPKSLPGPQAMRTLLRSAQRSFAHQKTFSDRVYLRRKRDRITVSPRMAAR